MDLSSKIILQNLPLPSPFKSRQLRCIVRIRSNPRFLNLISFVLSPARVSHAIVSSRRPSSTRKWWLLMDFNSASINNELVGAWWTWRGMNIYGARNGSVRESVEMIFFFFVFVSFGSMKMKIFYSNCWLKIFFNFRLVLLIHNIQDIYRKLKILLL